ncbi:outer membrane protein assembly factor BamE [Ramlibacter humi]|uniref:Outer membrane protein assembly factor BamE n=1 Tax=Ramlibacter humi TaxID=2530451 RepID=A0A4Z0BR36_9BURK|nr:outer membrane protein assembly factor BamE [Ramlibacter humi]TFZ01773.1 outer membrane protein assembly factor BamE [Ramlibacter humi]
MPFHRSSLLRPGLVFAACSVLAACGSFDSVSHRIASAVTPYKVEVVQGNFISREQVDQLKPGLSRQAVRDLLGTPLVTDLFHADRWDYVFTIKRDGVQAEPRRLTVYFKDDSLDRFEGDTMPSEAEFVASIGAKPRSSGKIPPLEATEEQLQKAAPPKPAAAASAPAPAAAPATSYPPLEPPAR